jgi:hypothetical protein
VVTARPCDRRRRIGREVSWPLGHGNSNVTRAVYLHEIRNAERAARRRDRLQRDYGRALDAASTSLSP